MRRGGGGDPAEHGQGLIEAALALPILLAIAGAIIDGAWAFHEAGMVAAAAQAAGRAAAIQESGTGRCDGNPPPSDEATAWAAARAAAPQLDPARLDIRLSYLEPACVGRMRTIVASAAYPITALTPWLAPALNGRRLTAQAAGAVEELPPPWWGEAGDIATDQAQIAALQTEVASLTAASQQAGAQAAYWSQAAGYYYTLWQSLLAQQRNGGGDGGEQR